MSRIGVVIVSDRAARGERADECLDVIRGWAKAHGHEVVADRLVPDEIPHIESAILDLCADRVEMVVTSGGTGLSPRDVTPEATRRVVERPTPGIDEALRRLSYEITPMAALSRGASGVRGSTLIVNLPGSPRAVAQQLEIANAFLAHGLDVLQGADHDPAAAASPHAPSPHATSPPDAERECHHADERVATLTGARHLHADAPLRAGATDVRDVQEPGQAHVPAGRAHDVHESGPHALGRHNLPDVSAPTAIHPPRRPLMEREEALARIFDVLRVLPNEEASLTEAIGRVAAEDVVAREDDPAFARSAMDGYAFPSLLADATGWLPVAATIQAGDAPAPWMRNDAVARILTGAPLGPGLDGVIPQEDVEVEESGAGRRVRFVVRPAVGDCVRPKGHSLPRGTRLVARGTRLGPGEIAVLTSAGEARVRVMRAPRVAIASTGDEVVSLAAENGERTGGRLPPGKIYDSNTPLLSALLRDDGGAVVSTASVPDTLEATVATLRDAIAQADVVLTVGGISVGDRDHVAPALEQLDAQPLVRGVNFRPGRPFSAFAIGEALVLALPGNPLSVLATYVLFVRPILDRMTQAADAEQGACAIVDEAVANPGARWWAALARLHMVGDTLHARVDTTSLDSGSLLPLTRTNGFVLLPPDVNAASGDAYPVFPVRRGGAL